MATRAFTAAVLCASAAVQLVALAFVGNRVSGGDAQTYIDLSHDWTSLGRLISPGAFEDNFWPAGYPGFLALLGFAGDNQLMVARLLQIAMVLVLAWMAGQIASSVSPRAGAWTLLAVAFSPTMMWAVWAIGYELLLGLLLTLALWLIWSRRPTHWILAASGLSAGLALIVQFRAITAVPVIAWLSWRAAHRRAGWWLAGALVPLGLWSLRTLLAIGSPVPWSSNGGYNLWDGNGPHATGHNVFPLPPIPPGTASYADAALTWIAGNPSEFIELSARKALFLTYPPLISDISERLPAAAVVSILQWLCAGVIVAMTLVFAGALAWRVHTPLRRLTPVFCMVILFLLPNVLFIVEARFRIPVEPLLLALTVTTLTVWLPRLRRAPSIADGYVLGTPGPETGESGPT